MRSPNLGEVSLCAHAPKRENQRICTRYGAERTGHRDYGTYDRVYFRKRLNVL